MTSTLLGPSIASAQETTESPPICRTTDGRRWATEDQVRQCLKDEATAQTVADALAAAEKATGRANAEAGRRMELEALLVDERHTSDTRLVTVTLLEAQVGQLEGRWRFGWGLAGGVVIGVAATIVGLLVAK